MASLPPLSADLAGVVVAGKYRVQEPVGHGAMGSVWSARHVSLGHTVAIKFIHPELISNKDMMRRFETEAKAAAKLRSRHVAQVHDHGVTSDGLPYIVMEFLDGQSLESAIDERGPLPPAEVIAIICEAAVALDVAHSAGVVHRDLKPDNIMLARDVESKPRGYTVKLVDFGIAKLVEDEVANVGTTRAGAVLGTPRYMSPEGLTGSAPVGPRSDLWALGASAFAAMVGRVPFEGETIGDVVLKRLQLADAGALRAADGRSRGVRRVVRPGVPARSGAPVRVRARDERSAAEARSTGHRSSRQGPVPDPPVRSVGARRHRDPRRADAEPRALDGRGRARRVARDRGLGMFVWKRTEEANRAILDAAASAQAAVDAENERRARAAERAWLAAQEKDAAAIAASTVPDAGPRPKRKKN